MEKTTVVWVAIGLPLTSRTVAVMVASSGPPVCVTWMICGFALISITAGVAAINSILAIWLMEPADAVIMAVPEALPLVRTA